jgi:GNAT superfamily N-acetyltransferase
MKEIVENSMPRDDAEQEDTVWTPERVREWEKMLVRRGMERWSAYVRERRSGQFAGYTEVVWRRSQPDMLLQWDTGVIHEFRNRGIGRWLKAAMIEKVQRDRPEVHEVRTGNSLTNASMLRINHEMGFKPYQTTYSWQIALETVVDYLSSLGGSN